MFNLKQKTVRSNVSFSGVGLHSGITTEVNILPALPNTGLIFKRVDLIKNNIIIPNVNNVSSANYCTTISNTSGASVSTVEHLMCALFIAGIDNAIIEVNSGEIPILDGSAKLFLEKILDVGFEISDQPIRIIKLKNRVEYRDGEKFITLEPSNINFQIEFEIKYKNQLIGNQKNKVNVYEDDLTDIINSRTFCLFEDIEKLKKIGLAKGGSLDNAIVVNGSEILNPNGLRNEKEFVNHKILDCIGDIYLSGYKIVAKVKCSQGGHKLTNEVLKKVYANPANFSIVEIKEKNISNLLINQNYLKSIA